MSVNKVILLGNLGADPEVRYTSGGALIVRIRLATTKNWRDRQTGERKKATEWHRVVFFEPLSKTVEQYVHSGDMLYIEGSIRTRKWQDQQQQDRYTTEIVGEQISMLGRRHQSDSPTTEGSSSEPVSAPAQKKTTHQATHSSSPSQRVEKEDFVDDIPF